MAARNMVADTTAHATSVRLRLGERERKGDTTRMTCLVRRARTPKATRDVADTDTAHRLEAQKAAGRTKKSVTIAHVHRGQAGQRPTSSRRQRLRLSSYTHCVIGRSDSNKQTPQVACERTPNKTRRQPFCSSFSHRLKAPPRHQSTTLRDWLPVRPLQR